MVTTLVVIGVVLVIAAAVGVSVWSVCRIGFFGDWFFGVSSMAFQAAGWAVSGLLSLLDN